MKRNARGLVVAIAVMGILWGKRLDAGWPMARHDAKRTGAASGKSDIATPVPYWRTYLGGSIGPGQFATIDVDGDGNLDLLFASSGRIVAKHADDSPIWTSESRGVANIVALADLDGDGTIEIVAYSGDKALVFAAKTGALLWAEPDGEIGTMGRVLVDDLDGDGKPEVVTLECGCCGVNSGKTGFVRSFAAGASTPTLLWTIPAVACGAGSSLMTVDVDGDGKRELLLGLSDHFELLRGSDGLLLAQTAILGTWIASSVCTAANLDAAPGDEVACLLTSSNLPQTDQRKAFLLKFNGTSTLQQPWKIVLAPDVGGDVSLLNPVADLDGDGKFELMLSGFDPINGWSTRIVDPTTGADLVGATLGQRYLGSAATEETGKRVFLTEAGTKTAAWTFTRSPTPLVTPRWALADQKLLFSLRSDRGAKGGQAQVALVQDLNGDGLDDLLFRSTSGTSTLYAYAGAAGVATPLAMKQLPDGVNVLNVWGLPSPGFGGARIALARTDGLLNLLDAMLVSSMTTGEFASELGIHVGGYYASGGWRNLTATARSAALTSGAPDSILATDSRGFLLRFDPKDSSWAVPPTQTWAVLGHTGPTIVPGLDGTNPGIACIGYDGQAQTVAVLSGDGTTLWSKPIENYVLNDLVPGKFDADAVPDLVTQWGSPGDVVLHTRAYSGADGSILWNAAPVSPGAGRQSAGVSVERWDGDDRDDVCTQGPKTQILSGLNGTVIGNGGPAQAYSMSVFADVNGDGTDELVIGGGYSPVLVYSHDLTTALWTSLDDDRPYPYGAIADCPAGKVLVEASSQHPARLKLTHLATGALGTFSTEVLAHGKRYADEAAAAADGTYLGQLTSAAVHQNLSGTGRPSALVGSSDGNLYGVNPCDGSLDFAVTLGVAVGDAIFADTDGDGRDEIIVGAADGYLYGLKNQNVAAPVDVIDLDPGNPGTGDVDLIANTGRMAASWTAVTGATRYEVNAVDDQGVALSTWHDVGTAAQATIDGLPTKGGSHYVFAVRAVVAAGPSVDATTNGVTIMVALAADAGTDGGGTMSSGSHGCGCELGGRPSASALVLALLAVGLLCLRRRLG